VCRFRVRSASRNCHVSPRGRSLRQSAKQASSSAKPSKVCLSAPIASATRRNKSSNPELAARHFAGRRSGFAVLNDLGERSRACGEDAPAYLLRNERAYKTRTSARQPAGLRQRARSNREFTIAGVSCPHLPSRALRSRPQITLVKRGSRVRIPPSASFCRAKSGLLLVSFAGTRVQNAYKYDPRACRAGSKCESLRRLGAGHPISASTGILPRRPQS
jgi:hypothetical protein